MTEWVGGGMVGICLAVGVTVLAGLGLNFSLVVSDCTEQPTHAPCSTVEFVVLPLGSRLSENGKDSNSPRFSHLKQGLRAGPGC